MDHFLRCCNQQSQGWYTLRGSPWTTGYWQADKHSLTAICDQLWNTICYGWAGGICSSKWEPLWSPFSVLTPGSLQTALKENKTCLALDSICLPHSQTQSLEYQCLSRSENIQIHLYINILTRTTAFRQAIFWSKSGPELNQAPLEIWA